MTGPATSSSTAITVTSPSWRTDGRRPSTSTWRFPAPDDATVAEFHRVALAAGGRDNGAPGERPEYHAGYVGAFVLDPNGGNVEAVNHNR